MRRGGRGRNYRHHQQSARICKPIFMCQVAVSGRELLTNPLPRRSCIKPACSAAELGLLLGVLRTREARLGVPRGAGAGGTPLAYPHNLQVPLCVLGR
jgi:hypothetical protein